MKNPDNRPLEIVPALGRPIFNEHPDPNTYAIVLSNLAVAEAILVSQGKDSGLPHFIAIVKEIERLFNFRFVFLDEVRERGEHRG